MAQRKDATGQISTEVSTRHLEIYSKLDKECQQFRVMEVLAGIGNESHLYETISYVWGDSSQRDVLFVDGVHMDAPASSVRVLRRVRHPHKSRVVWIDAICIDQTNIEERGQQVAIMGTIYASSVRNLIRLGEEDHDTALALSSIAAISSDIEHEANNDVSLREILYPGAFNAAGGGGPQVSRSGLSVELDQEALLRFFRSAWFSRLWICQESSLSPENICYKGNFEIDFKDVLRAALWIRYKQRYLPLIWSASMENAADLADWSDHTDGYFRFTRDASLPPGIVLASILWSLRNFEAGDPRDHVYAVLGLCEAYSNTRPNIVPDYGTDTADAFRRATKFIVEDNGDLRIFRDISRRMDDVNDPTFTTWVPRYDWKRDNSREPYRLVASGHKADGGESMAMRQDHEQRELLVLRGFEVDIITHRTASPCESDSAATIHEFLSSVEETVAGTAGELPQATRNMIATTLRGGRKSPDEEEDGELYASYKHELVQQSAESTLGMAKGRAGDKGLAAFRTAFTLSCHARSFFRTAHGYIGIGPHTLQMGDSVAILYGSCWPVILRRFNRHIADHEFIGISYVYGIMEGEAVRNHKSSNEADIDVRLR